MRLARRALARLILDGRIHPAHIEKIAGGRDSKAVDKIIDEAGEQAAFDAGVTGLHPEVMRMMGRLKFRTSYGQNQLAHAVEVSKLAGILAAELGANVEICQARAASCTTWARPWITTRKAPTPCWAPNSAKRYGVNPQVVNAIASHHHEVEQETVEAVIAEAADAISGARPGARREDLEAYIKRIRTLEEMAMSFKGVQPGLRHPGRTRSAHHRQARRRSTTWPPPAWRATSPRRSKRPCSIPVRSG